MNIKKLIGSAVITKDGTILGEVSDVVIDRETNKVIALLVATRSLIPLTKTVRFNKILLSEKKRIVIDSKNDLISLSSLELPRTAMLYAAEIDKKKVFDSQNNHIGKIRDMVFSMEAGEISDFLIYDGFIQNLFRRGSQISSKNNIYINRHTKQRRSDIK